MLSVTSKNGKISVRSPYHADLPSRARQLGGRWNGRAWTFDERDHEAVSNLYRDVYGYMPALTNGQDDSPRVDVTVTVKETWYSDRAPILLGGYVLAQARGRDTGAWVGTDVRLTDGQIASGGSRVNWTTVIKGGSVFIIRDVPIARAQAMRDTAPSEVSSVDFEMPTEDSTPIPTPSDEDIATTRRTLQALIASGMSLAEAARHCGIDA